MIAIESKQKQQDSLNSAVTCARMCADYRGQDTKILDLTQVTPLFDFFVITTGTSRRQMVSIAEAADDLMKATGSARLGMEGHESANWILHDYGDVVLHILDEASRETYSLERLWADATEVDWQKLEANSDSIPETRSV